MAVGDSRNTLRAVTANYRGNMLCAGKVGLCNCYILDGTALHKTEQALITGCGRNIQAADGMVTAVKGAAECLGTRSIAHANGYPLNKFTGIAVQRTIDEYVFIDSNIVHQFGTCTRIAIVDICSKPVQFAGTGDLIGIALSAITIGRRGGSNGVLFHSTQIHIQFQGSHALAQDIARGQDGLNGILTTGGSFGEGLTFPGHRKLHFFAIHLGRDVSRQKFHQGLPVNGIFRTHAGDHSIHVVGVDDLIVIHPAPGGDGQHLGLLHRLCHGADGAHAFGINMLTGSTAFTDAFHIDMGVDRLGLAAFAEAIHIRMGVDRLGLAADAEALSIGMGFLHRLGGLLLAGGTGTGNGMDSIVLFAVLRRAVIHMGMLRCRLGLRHDLLRRRSFSLFALAAHIVALVHALFIVAFSGVLRVMGAQIVLRGRKGHHGKILHHHGQCQQTAQQLLRSFIFPHNKSSLAGSINGGRSLNFTERPSWQASCHERGISLFSSGYTK